jgi:hypothetical protein
METQTVFVFRVNAAVGPRVSLCIVWNCIDVIAFFIRFLGDSDFCYTRTASSRLSSLLHHMRATLLYRDIIFSNMYNLIGWRSYHVTAGYVKFDVVRKWHTSLNYKQNKSLKDSLTVLPTDNKNYQLSNLKLFFRSWKRPFLTDLVLLKYVAPVFIYCPWPVAARVIFIEGQSKNVITWAVSGHH